MSVDLTERRGRALQILSNMSEFLRALDMKESDILKSMVVKFAIEGVDATRGSLYITDNINMNLVLYDTFVYRQGKAVLRDITKELSYVSFRYGENVCGRCYENKEAILIEEINQESGYIDIIDKKLGIEPYSVICVPITIEDDIIAVIELVREKGMKPFDREDLAVVNIITNLTSTIMENAKLFMWAISDGLTKLYNIHYFRREVEREIKRSRRYNREFSIIMIDVDNFKEVNDTYGHQAGDEVLKYVADIIKSNIRVDIDIPARYGGDEFILMLPNTSLYGASVVIERIMSIIKINMFKLKGNKKIEFFISAGISSFPQDGTTQDEIIEAADKALYYSKNMGKNRYTIYSSII